MQAFEYGNPTTLADAFKLFGTNSGEAEILAGGTDLLSLIKDEVVASKRLVNIKNIKELGGITAAGGGVRIGATATFDELAAHAAVRQHRAIQAAVLGVGSPQIRNMGTAGGDLCQRPRCWYYRSGMGLFAMKDGKSLIPEGENRYHSI